MYPQVSLVSTKAHGISRRALIYYVCGNPGLIEFYNHFLSSLRGLLDNTEANTAYDIYGRNLLGFSDADNEPFGHGNEPYDLKGQILGIYEDVMKKGKGYDFVVLMGHSVGGYIIAEMMHRHLLEKKNKKASNTYDNEDDVDLRYGFLLFPTLTEIGKSPSGTRVELVRRYMPLLDATAHTLAGFVISLFTPNTLIWIIKNVMGFTPDTAEVTAKWLKSRDGIWQAIHLGKSELETIREEVWEQDLWEVAHEDDGDEEASREKGDTRFWIFYGKKDHWVADAMRDAFIERRRSVNGKGTNIEVDEGDLPHAFCVKQDSSWAVAKMVHGWIEEIETKTTTKTHE